jgi:hypothetical protein
MKVAVLSESAGDEAGVRRIVSGVLARPVEDVSTPRLRSRGWPSVRNILPVVMLDLHFRSDAEGLVVVVDSDDSPHHLQTHEVGPTDDQCRVCQLRETVNITRRRLTPLPGKSILKVAVGMAVPAIEAWYMVGIDSRASEAVWQLGVGSRSYSKRSLKSSIYGTERPDLALETRHAVQASARLVNHLTELESMFPGGFGSLARDLRSW